MIPAILTADKRRVLCLLGWHDWEYCYFPPELEIPNFKVCRVAACQKAVRLEN